MTNTYATTVVVIGAGAAGLAAARMLHDAGVAVRVVEARPRIGGRIAPDTSFADAPIELGAELIHGRDTSTMAIASEQGWPTAAVDRYQGLRWSSGAAALPQAELAEETRNLIERLRQAYAALVDVMAPEGVLLPPQHDRSLADYLRHVGFSGEELAVADVLLAQTWCATIATLSCADLAREMLVDRAGPEEFRLIGGYQPLLTWLARDLEIDLEAPVEAISYDEQGVTVVAEGLRVQADYALITLPIGVLQREVVQFDPPLRAARRRAIAAFRLEAATKLFLRFDQPYWDAELTYMGHLGQLARWWTPHHHLPQSPILCSYVTADRARRLDRLSDEAARRLALEEAGRLLGVPDLAAHCTGMRRMAWATDPYASGGYAHIPPAAVEARAILAAPEHRRLHFAGEATAIESNTQTVHGAIDSGRRAAQAILAQY